MCCCDMGIGRVVVSRKFQLLNQPPNLGDGLAQRIPLRVALLLQPAWQRSLPQCLLTPAPVAGSPRRGSALIPRASEKILDVR